MHSTTSNLHIKWSFINVSHTELWILNFFVISQSEQICKSGTKYAHSVTTDHVSSICAHHYIHIPSFTKISHCVFIEEAKVYAIGWNACFIHVGLCVQTLWPSSSLTGGSPQKKQKTKTKTKTKKQKTFCIALFHISSETNFFFFNLAYNWSKW